MTRIRLTPTAAASCLAAAPQTRTNLDSFTGLALRRAVLHAEDVTVSREGLELLLTGRAG